MNDRDIILKLAARAAVASEQARGDGARDISMTLIQAVLETLDCMWATGAERAEVLGAAVEYREARRLAQMPF